jgi:hypothetical protein
MKINDNGIDRDMTPDEIAYITDAQKEAQLQAEADAALLAKQAAAAKSARAKLADLGLTESEIKALVG